MPENSKYIELLDQAFDQFLSRDPETALNLCEQAIKIFPERGEHLFMLGIVSLGFNDAGRAIKFMEEGHKREPDWLEFAQALTTLNAEVGNLSDSLYYSKLELILDSNPDVKKWMPDSFGGFIDAIEKVKIPTYMLNGWVDFHEHRYLSAAAYCEREFVINPDNDDCYQLYGRASVELHEFERAIDALEKAIQLNPNNVEHHFYYADVLLAAGYADKSVTACRESLKTHPSSLALRNRLISALPYCKDDLWSDCASEIMALAAYLNADTSDETKGGKGGKGGRPEKICVGFLVNQHALNEFSDFLGPVFQSYDRSRFRFIGYQQYAQAYPGTAIFSKALDDWRETFDINDPTLAHIIKNDGVDILVDICGVQAGNRQRVIAGLSGPVRVNWLGSPAIAVSTITDAILCDDASLDQFEQSNPGVMVKSIGTSLVAYAGGSAALDVGAENPAPVQINNRVTFGAALNLMVIECSAPLWAEVLKNVKGSRLLLGGRGEVLEGTKRRIQTIFNDLDVGDSVVLQDGGAGTTSHGLFLGSIDILLESKLVSGTTLIADALWSGVPVIGLRARRPVSCIGASILGAAGQQDWIAEDDDEFIKIAKRLAEDAKALIKMRGDLRGKIKQSALCDGAGFAKVFSQALEEIWTKVEK